MQLGQDPQIIIPQEGVPLDPTIFPDLVGGAGAAEIKPEPNWTTIAAVAAGLFLLLKFTKAI